MFKSQKIRNKEDQETLADRIISDIVMVIFIFAFSFIIFKEYLYIKKINFELCNPTTKEFEFPINDTYSKHKLKTFFKEGEYPPDSYLDFGIGLEKRTSQGTLEIPVEIEGYFCIRNKCDVIRKQYSEVKIGNGFFRSNLTDMLFKTPSKGNFTIMVFVRHNSEKIGSIIMTYYSRINGAFELSSVKKGIIEISVFSTIVVVLNVILGNLRVETLIFLLTSLICLIAINPIICYDYFNRNIYELQNAFLSIYLAFSKINLIIINFYSNNCFVFLNILYFGVLTFALLLTVYKTNPFTNMINSIYFPENETTKMAGMLNISSEVFTILSLLFSLCYVNRKDLRSFFVILLMKLFMLGETVAIAIPEIRKYVMEYLGMDCIHAVLFDLFMNVLVGQMTAIIFTSSDVMINPGNKYTMINV